MNPLLAFLRKVIPRKIQTLIRLYQIFNQHYGHTNIQNGLIQNGKGKPLPWITYPAIEFLETLDLSDCDIFEFGAGSSTLFWANRARSVTSVERESDWFERIKDLLPKNCKLAHKKRDAEYISFLKEQEKKFDIIVVDGSVRYPCTEAAIDSLSGRGIVILDNSDWYPNCCRLLRSRGFTQIDFSGFPPLNAFTASTSLFFKNPMLLSRKKTETLPMGGRTIAAYDDCVFEKIEARFLNL